MRAFIAIDLPETLRSSLGQCQAFFRPSAPGARWVRPEGIHLTLKFLGEVEPVTLEKIKESLKTAGRFEPFRVEIIGFGFFPDARRPKVFWAGVEAGPGLAELAGHVEGAMASLGFPPEERPFRPHLTLARFREPRPQPALAKVLEQQTELTLGAFDACEFFLFESRLSPGGAEYVKIARFP